MSWPQSIASCLAQRSYKTHVSGNLKVFVKMNTLVFFYEDNGCTEVLNTEASSADCNYQLTSLPRQMACGTSPTCCRTVCWILVSFVHTKERIEVFFRISLCKLFMQNTTKYFSLLYWDSVEFCLDGQEILPWKEPHNIPCVQTTVCITFLLLFGWEISTVENTLVLEYQLFPLFWLKRP